MYSVSHIINSVYTSRTYIIANETRTEYWLVDCGDVPPLMEKMSDFREGSFVIRGVLLTHIHYDHFYGLPKLTELFPEIKVYTNEYGRKALANERMNMSRYHEDPINYVTDNVMVCEEGSRIELFEGLTAKVYETPGHNPSCLTFELGDYLFTGDSYIPGIKVVTNLPGGNKSLAQQSLERIKKLSLGKIVCAGHDSMEGNY